MRKNLLAGSVCLASLLCAQGPNLNLSFLDGLAAKAKETTNIDLGPEQIEMAGSLLAGGDSPLKGLGSLKGIRRVMVRSFEFEKPGQYSKEDVQKIDDQLKGCPAILQNKDGEESTTIRMCRPDGKNVQLSIVAAEPNQLSVIHVIGEFGPELLKGVMQMGGQIGSTLPAEKAPKARIAPKAKP